MSILRKHLLLLTGGWTIQKCLTNRFGPKGYSWDYLENGKWTELANIPSGEPRTMENSTLYATWGYGIPYWCFGDFWAEKEITAETALERQGALNESYMKVAAPGLPELVYEEDENREALNIKTDLFKYVDSQLAQFITNGVTDESWDAYIKKNEGSASGSLGRALSEILQYNDGIVRLQSRQLGKGNYECIMDLYRSAKI